MSEEGWTTVKGRSFSGRRRRRGDRPEVKRNVNSAVNGQARDGERLDKGRVSRGLERVQRRMRLFDANKPFAFVVRQICDLLEDTNIEKIISFGLGSIGGLSANPAVQLALLVKIAQIWEPKLSAFDPVFTRNDTEILKQLGVARLEDNSEGKHRVGSEKCGGDDYDSFTLFYMPHCDMWLYSNLLWANWSARSLRRIVIIGNSFEGYAQGLRRNKDPENCVRIIHPYAEETKLRVALRGPEKREHRGDASAVEGAFSDTSIITFSDAALERAEAAGVFKARPAEKLAGLKAC